MWLFLAFISASMLGLYDVFKKRSLQGNAVLPVLAINTIFCCLFFMPLIVMSACGVVQASDSYYIPQATTQAHIYVIIKALIVLSSWICGYFAIKNLPITLVGPINATRPVMTLIGAMAVFGEQLNGWQWAGVTIACISFFLLSRSGKKEGISFAHNRWIMLLLAAAILGATSGLYDKHLMMPASEGGLNLNPLFVQAWYNTYQACIMLPVIAIIWWPHRKNGDRFKWKWTIPLISIFITMADLAYFLALSQDGAMISIVSMVRRSSVIVSFLFGAFLFHESNLRSKAIDLILILLSMVCLCIGNE